MSKITAVDTTSGLDFDEIEQAVMETTRGRWFLTEFARRQRANDTKILLAAIRRLEDQLLAMPVAASSDIDKLVQEAETEMRNLSGPARISDIGTASDEPANARVLAARLVSITDNLRGALAQPAGQLAQAIEPEIRRLEACSNEQDNLADKLAQTAQLVHRIRASSEDIQISPETPVVAQTATASKKPADIVRIEPVKYKPAPAFEASDDDIFEDNEPAPQEDAPTVLPQIDSDTLDFSNIHTAPIEAVSETETTADEHEPIDANESEQVEQAAQIQEPDQTPERVISVTRTQSGKQHSLTQQDGPVTYGGKINLHNPASTNQISVPANAPAAPSTASNGNGASSGIANSSSSSSSKKRIIVIRRAAEEDSDIPLAGSTPSRDGDPTSAS